MTATTLCHLCKIPAELSRSHVLPEFLYRPLYDEKHRFVVLTVGAHGQRYAQRGFTEKLLCHQCEQHLCQYEKYAAEVMTGRKGHRFQKHGDRITVNGIDYARFKLFQMSVLWRASVSSLDFFRLVSLGPREERLREMLLVGEPGGPEEFGCAVIFARDRGEDISDTLFNPEPLRWAGRRMYKFFFAGSAWLFHCDHQPAATHLKKMFLQKEGSLIGLSGDLADARKYGALAKRLARDAGYLSG